MMMLDAYPEHDAHEARALRQEFILTASDEALHEIFTSAFGHVQAQAHATRAPDIAGDAGQVRKLVYNLTRPGSINIVQIRDVFVELKPLVKSDEGLAEFVNGPPGQAEMSGLRWCASILHQAVQAPVDAWSRWDPSNPSWDCWVTNIVLETLRDFAGEKVTDGPRRGSLLISQPWGKKDVFAPTGILPPLHRLAQCCVNNTVDETVTKNIMNLAISIADDQRALPAYFKLGWHQHALGFLRERCAPGSSTADALLCGMNASLIPRLISQSTTDSRGKRVTSSKMLPPSKKALLDASAPATLLSALRASNDSRDTMDALGSWDTREEHSSERLLYLVGYYVAQTIHSLCVGSPPCIAAFAREQGLAEELVRALRLPIALGNSKYIAATRNECQIARAIASLGLDEQMAGQLVDAGVIDTALDAVCVPPFTGVGSASTEHDQEVLVVTIVHLLQRLCASHPLVKEQLRARQDIIHSLARRGCPGAPPSHCDDFVRGVDVLIDLIGDSPSIQAASVSPESGNALHATVSVGKKALDMSFISMESILPGGKPRKREEIAASAAAARESGFVDKAAREMRHLRYIEKMEACVEHFKWAIEDKDGTVCWLGAHDGLQVVLLEYPIGDQPGRAPGDMGIDAILKTKEFGLLPLPHDLARRLKAEMEKAAKEGRIYDKASLHLCCAHCGANIIFVNLKKCSRCGAVSYCSRECQVAAWKAHKKVCANKGAGAASSSTA